ncbi:MAG: HEAT repeat domain-containing protein [Peptococcaceae bacterium]|nr:HEAT repeat domain-containing protein [Peptococcaceae bacterium]
MHTYNTIPFRSRKYQRQQALQSSTDIARIASQWIMRRDQLPEYRFAIELMSQADREEMFWTTWDMLDSFAQRDLARAAFGDYWFKLLAGYSEFTVPQKVQALEALGYIHNQNVVNFLVQELRRDDDALRLAAAGALKKQDPLLVIEPMLEALNKPEHYLASRIYDVLEALGPKLVPIILQRIEQASISGKIVMVQLLGTFGDESVIPALTPYLESDNYLLKKMAVEALVKLQGQDICPVLTNLLMDEAWQIRLMAAEAIGRGRFTVACPALREAYTKESDTLVKELMEEILHTIDTNNETITYLWTRQRSKENNERERNSGRSN